MIRCLVELPEAGRVLPAPFVSGDGRATAWLEIDGVGTQLAVYGAPADMRALAVAAVTAVTAAERAEALGGAAAQARSLAGADGTG